MTNEPDQTDVFPPDREQAKLNAGTAPEAETAETEQQQQTPVSKMLGGSTEVSMTAGGIIFKNQEEIVNAARLMSHAGAAVGPHCRNNPGMCWSVILQAIEWRMSPLTVARMSFVTNDTLGFFSQLLHAVLEARAPLKERLRMRYEGEGGERVCIVTGTFKGEHEPRELRSPPLKDLHPGYTLVRQSANEKSKRRISYAEGQRMKAAGELKEGETLMVAGSQEWERKPDKQLFYDTSRDWGRIHAPDIMAGLYSDEELQDYSTIRSASDSAIDVTAAGEELAKRLAEAKADAQTAGFHAGVLDEAKTAESKRKPNRRKVKRRTEPKERS